MTDKNTQRGLFISFEGGDGCGKSTQIAMLADALPRLTRQEIVVTRSPGGTPVAERIRTILKTHDDSDQIVPETELLLFGACHVQMTRNLILPALERNAIIITDRFYDSTTVYQGYARGIELDFVQKINTFACGGFKPDLTILLDAAVEHTMGRAANRNGNEEEVRDRFDSEGLAFHDAIRQGFLCLAKQEPERFRVINAELSIEEIHLKIMEAVCEKLALS